MNILEYLIFGLFCGFAEFLPVSSEAHMLLLSKIFGNATVRNSLRLMVHIGSFAALLASCMPQISKISRENKLASQPPRYRKRQPDMQSVRDWKLLKVATACLLICFIAYPWIGRQGSRLWILCIFLVLSGILQYIPQFMPGANKDARNTTRLDAVLIGLFSGFGVLPGFSRVGAAVSIGSIRGLDREYSLHMALLLSLPALAVLCLIDLAYIFAYDLGSISLMAGIGAILAGIMSAVSSYFGIIFMRFLSVKVGFSAFSYYSWGAALFSFILYLMI